MEYEHQCWLVLVGFWTYVKETRHFQGILVLIDNDAYTYIYMRVPEKSGCAR